MNFSFHTFNEYMNYKQDWKKRYQETMLDIRSTKNGFKDFQREYSKLEDGGNYWDSWMKVKTAAEKAKFDNVCSGVSSSRQNFYSAKERATQLLAERALSKERAGQLRSARLRERETVI